MDKVKYCFQTLEVATTLQKCCSNITVLRQLVVRESSYSREMVVDKWLIRTQRLRRSAEMAMHEAWARKGLVPDRSCPFGSTDTKRARETH